VNPWLLKTPASPHLAARKDGVAIRYERIAAAFARQSAASDLVLVEGAGGWLAPISGTETMADIARALALPVILVVGLRLGCLNHALLTREALRAGGFRFAGWIANKLATPLALVPPGATGTHPRSAPAPTWALEAAKKLVSP
jgi:dethiobiotin synthetase